jgi:hypothetical protein
MNRSALARLDLDPLDITCAVLFPIYGLGAGIMLGLSRDFRREGLVLLAVSIVACLLLVVVLLAIG